MDTQEFKINQEDTQPNEPILEWMGDVHVQHDRSTIWYGFAGAFVLFLMLYSIWTAAWTFTFLLIIMSAMYYMVHKVELPPKRAVITNTGIQIGVKFYAWAECEAFWMLQSHSYVELHIRTKRNSTDNIYIHTGTMDPHRIRETMARFLPELSEQREQTLDMILRLLKI